MIFSVSERGSAHVPKGVPCQDYSIHYESDDGTVQLVIVCDGHGEAACCRSDQGSLLAAVACRRAVLDRLDEIAKVVAGKAGAVTTSLPETDLLWGKRKLDPASDLYQQLAEQRECYIAEASKNLDVEHCMRNLFKDIRERWGELVDENLKRKAFTELERDALGNRPQERAFGTTLLCYVQTTTFWFAFQVGDGRILLANRKSSLSEGSADAAHSQESATADDFVWWQPVPWDARCFMNRTTSLCGMDAEMDFRYAFDGCGNFPLAALCCSDGVEDSFGDYEGGPQGLHKFFTQVVTTMQQEGELSTVLSLRAALPEISALRSHDDMSLAAIVNE